MTMSKESAIGWLVVAIYIILNIVLHVTGVSPDLTNYVDGGLGIILAGIGVKGLKSVNQEK